MSARDDVALGEISVEQQTNSEDNDFDTTTTTNRMSSPQSSSLQPTTRATTLSTKSTTTTIIKQKLLLLTPLLLSLALLTDTTYLPQNIAIKRGIITQKLHLQHLAFITALSRHTPGLRIFRIVSEGCWLMLCMAFALWVWERVGIGSGRVAMSTSESESESSNSSSDNNSVMNGGYTDDNNNDEDSKDCESSDNDTNIAACVGQLSPVQITPNVIGNLLFQPPPNTITTNAAWEVVTRKHQSFIRRRRRRRGKRKILGKKKSSNEQENSAGDDEIDSEINENTSDHENGILNGHSKKLSGKSSSEEEEQQEEQQQLPIIPPSSTSVLGAALDIMTLMSMFLILFTISSAEGGRYIDQRGSSSSSLASQEEPEQQQQQQQLSWMKYIAQISAPIFPIILFIVSIVMILLPWYKRKNVWTIVSLTIGAPFYNVTFRDGFVGDVITSIVRPLQDIAYTAFYLMPNLGGGSASSERNWMLHTVILPGCTLSPLWWRFLQNLRQCYDTKQRWPYMGNAFKYLLAAEVATFGIFDPSIKSSSMWLMCFGIATLYQVWWDVFMDWGLLVREEEASSYYYYEDSKGWFKWWPYSLRTQRLYKHKWVYYIIFVINFCLRFVGMLTLIPPVYLSRSTGLVVNTYNDPDFQLFVGSIIASAEIFRRTIWALLRLEWEVIKTDAESRKNAIVSAATIQNDTDDDDDKLLLSNGNTRLMDEEGMKPMAIGSSSSTSQHFKLWSSSRGGTIGAISMNSLSDMSNLNDIQILSELCVWSTVFSGIAIIAAAHREVL